ncbi:hypothetical protein HMPREF9695_04334 [Afipia broomeae ATCC 49717]|uniref:WSC domain-containing protein n=1 Tax=Afipia broomeae ATCC 49717 TaxID=883078 RepID=K8P108_9BRAD|nr:hypothetical protein HMPREF9695_04334 [Afipia broomeae ATCC 49717]
MSTPQGGSETAIFCHSRVLFRGSARVVDNAPKARRCHAGTQDASYCFCGNAFGKFGKSDGCNAECTGNREETCGGTWANAIYKVN